MTEPHDLARRLLDGRYRFLDPVVHSGTGTVWSAVDISTNRPVTVRERKLPPDMESDRQRLLVARVLKAARAADRRLRHPGVHRVLDAVAQEGLLWIVTAPWRGRPVGELLRRNTPLKTAQVCEIGLQVLDILEAAHKQQLVHGGLEPSCVLVDEDGQVTLTEFGVAAAIDALSGGQERPFASPEQTGGRRPDPACDLWSTGALLNAMAGPAVVRWPDGPLALTIEGLLRRAPAERLTADVARRALLRLLEDAEPPRQVPQAGLPTVMRRRARAALIGRSCRTTALAASAVLVVGALALVLVTQRGGGGSSGVKGSGAAHESTAPPTADPSASDAASPQPSGVPESFYRATDPEGFSIALPLGWKRVGNNGFSSGTRYGDEGDARRLLVDWTHRPGADQLTAWRRLERSVRASTPGYSRIGEIRSVKYRGYQAADWEWTFDFNGIHYRTLNRGFVVDSGHGYAIKWSVPAAAWNLPENQRALRTFLRTFRPADAATSSTCRYTTAPPGQADELPVRGGCR
ncbi:serine/threonine protein kinase [Wenjunlia tyrosinilytica]|nr:protein kinase [Wenjunlia tyrosinilytica]